jgi:hypothetical protein
MSNRCPEDIDPKREDVATKPRRRRHRLKPDPNPALVAAKAKLHSQALRRPLPPAIMFEREGAGYVHTGSHNDEDLWDLQIANAFGTRSLSVMREFLSQLNALCSKAWDESDGAWKPNESELSAILAMIVDLKPRNSVEAAMAAQLVLLHLMTMGLGAQAINHRGMVMERDAALAGKLASRFGSLMEIYQGLRGKRRSTRQTITVQKELHQSVHYHDHRGAKNADGQSHASPTEQPPQLPQVLCDNSGGQVVRLPSRSRKG